MPAIQLCFLWHMHQPFYKELASGEYRLPWVRLHALKDYFGMVKILDEFPDIHQTFNLVPSLLLQLEDYAAGTAKDPYLDVAMKPAEDLSRAQREFILTYFFQANPEQVIRRFPRYSELFDVFERYDRNPQRAVEGFDPEAVRDLQVLSQLAWFDEYDLSGDAEVATLVAKGRRFRHADQQLLAGKEQKALQRVLAAYQGAASRGQIEISTSPFYHPILPLMCDSDIANTSHPYVSLPSRFCYPEDGLEQLVRARDFIHKNFGTVPEGMWPSEGAVSEAALLLAERAGYRWTASDSEILSRSLGVEALGDQLYRPYRLLSQNSNIQMVFRDRRLSDLIALTYSQMDPEDAATHFVAEVRSSCSRVLENESDALVAIILDGENAWEKYHQNGRPFLQALYSLISQTDDVQALTFSEALSHHEAARLSTLHPGSWIDANFDMWIGDEEDNRAWDYLLKARQAYAHAAKDKISANVKAAAYEELLIAEGSDWCWWYGPENQTANQSEFDQLFREHLANVYRLLGQTIPTELFVPISKGALKPQHVAPTGLIQPTIDGKLTSTREWENAGRYSPDPRLSGLRGPRSPLVELLYGSDGQNLFIRVDLAGAAKDIPEASFVLAIRTSARQLEIRSQPGAPAFETDLPPNAIDVAIAEFYEARLSLSALHVRLGDPVHIRFDLLRGDLTLASLPQHGELATQSTSLAAYAY